MKCKKCGRTLVHSKVELRVFETYEALIHTSKNCGATIATRKR